MRIDFPFRPIFVSLEECVMRKIILATLALFLLNTVSAQSSLQWVKRPELTFERENKTWWASFELIVRLLRIAKNYALSMSSKD